ncbi:MAG: asparagine--tRNA ligase [Candidatus Magasanikbacteria bacterium]|nr:asparagine--tRNA ligase [Candidatus Magasanikbacteria bacterium]
MKILIANINNHVGEEVDISGWLYNMRSSGSIAFLEIRDGSGFIQAVVSKEGVGAGVWDSINNLTQESSLELTGKVTKHPKNKDTFELQVSNINIVQVSEEYPITKKEHGPDFLLNNRHLWLRSKKQWAILRIRDMIESAIHDFMHKEFFIRVDSPVLTPNACEGTTTLFSVPYFDLGEAYLSQTGQLYIEAAIASVGRCYDFGPVFRAEKSTTKRHLTEFWMMDAEAAFVDHEENLRIQEALVKYIVKTCLQNCSLELQILERNTSMLENLLEKPFLRYSYGEAVKKLKELGSDIKHGEDLGNDDEALLTKDSDVPIFIEKWPKSIKPFYMKIDPKNPDLVLNDDLIGIEGAGELVGGSQREDNFDLLLSRLEEEALPKDDYDWYLNLRKYGSIEHSGFGIGLERTVRWIGGVEHIRECISFPRLVNRISP